MRPFARMARIMSDQRRIAFAAWRTRMQVRWFVTAAGALAMLIITGVLIFNVVTAPRPLTKLTSGITVDER